MHQKDLYKISRLLGGWHANDPILLFDKGSFYFIWNRRVLDTRFPIFSTIRLAIDFIGYLLKNTLYGWSDDSNYRPLVGLLF